MARITEPKRPDPSGEAVPLPQPKKHLERYYAGKRMPSPMGGFLEPLRVRRNDDGSGTVFFECSASSLRYRLQVPKATRAERDDIDARQKAGDDLLCPRHGGEERLQRSRQGFFCPGCGVTYGSVP